MSVSETVFWFLKSPNLMCTRVYVTRKKTAKNSVAEDVALATILSDAAVQKKGRAILFTCVCQIRNSKANNQSLAQAFRSSLRDNGSCSTICFLMWTALQTRFWVDLPMGAQKVIYGKQHMLCRVWHKKRKNANLNFLDPLQCFANPEDCLRLGPAPKNLSWNQKSKKWREFS